MQKSAQTKSVALPVIIGIDNVRPANVEDSNMRLKVEQIEQMGRFEQLQLVEDLWDRFAAETAPETDETVLDELERRARWCREHPNQSRTLTQIAEALGIRL